MIHTQRTRGITQSRHSLRRFAYVCGALACLTVTQRVGAQRSTKRSDDAALLQCSATIARLLAPLTIPNGMPTRLGQYEDTTQLRIWSQRTKEHRDSAIAPGRACLATVNLMQLSDTLLDTLFDLQVKMHQDSALVATVMRIAHSALPVDDRAQSVVAKVWHLPPAVLRAQLPLVDSMQNLRTSADMRVELASAVRHVEPRAAYREVQQLIDYLAALTPAQRDTVISSAENAVFEMVQWAKEDSTTMGVMGLAEKIFTLFPNQADLRRPFLLAAGRVALVGAPARPFASPSWLYMPAGVTQLPVGAGKVTLVEFTDISCAACKLTYQPLQQWSNEFRANGLNIFFIVPPMQDMTPYKAMFDHFQVSLPVMADDWPQNVSYRTWYHDDVGHPMFVLIDKHGTIRALPFAWKLDYIKETALQLLSEQ